MTIENKNLADQVYDLIKNEILEQKYELGTQIDTRQIAEENNISIMPVRDALNRLEDNGLVEKKSRVGYFVRSFSEKEIEDIMEARKMYELYSLKEHFSNLDKNKLNKILDEMNTRKKNISEAKFEKIDYQLHDYIISISENYIIRKNYNNIKELMVLFRRLDNDRVYKANEEHIKFIEAVLDDNYNTAISRLRIHLENFTSSLLESHQKVIKN